MTKEQKGRIELLQALGLYDPNNKIASVINLKALENYSDDEIIEAATAHAQSSSYALKAFDVCDYWRKKSGNTEEDIRAGLALKAERVFNELQSKANSANDWIVADARAAVTIKALYGSPQGFSRAEKNLDDWPRRNFITRYQQVTAEEVQEAQRLFGGYYANTQDPMVTFLGNYQECLQLASELYAGRKPRIPDDPNAPKLPPAKVQIEAVPEEVSRRYIKLISEKLSQAIKKTNGEGVNHEINRR